MKRYYWMILLLLFQYPPMYGQSETNNQITITGLLKNNKNRNVSFDAGPVILVKSKSRLLAATRIDEQGKFNVTFTSDGSKNFDIIYSQIGLGYIFIGLVNPSDNSQQDPVFEVPLTVKKNFFGHLICPKCNKANKTVEVEDEDDDTCIRGPIRRYCSRDNIDF